AVVAYAAIAGPRPPVVRAVVLTLTALTALSMGRRTSRLNLLGGAALGVAALAPAEWFRTGTQLSFLSAAVLLALARWTGRHRQSDPLDQLLADAAPWPHRAARRVAHGMRSMAIVSLVVWLVALPLVAGDFHIAAPICIVATPVLWPLVAVALACGIGTLTVGWLLPPLDLGLGKVAAVCLAAVERLVAIAERAPGGHFYGPGPPAWWTLATYLALAGAVLYVVDVRGMHRKSRQLGWALGIALAWGALGGVLTAYQRPMHDRWRCSFLAVGHGTCVVIQSPNGRTYLYDAGSLGSPVGAPQVIAEYLWLQGIRRIDGLFISHADLDHYNAIPGLLKRFRVANAYASPQTIAAWNDAIEHAEPETAGLALLKRSLDDAGTTVHAIADGAMVADDGGPPQQEGVAADLGAPRDTTTLRFHILHPRAGRSYSSDNASSLTLAVECEGRCVLLAGDLEDDGMDEFQSNVSDLWRAETHCDVALAPHHGSVHGDPAGFAQWCGCQWLVVSGDASDCRRMLESTEETRDVATLCTGLQGAVEFELTRSRVLAS
ncbi:MAG: ComEC/Rec2 family competence protein, partial [Planctomycetales bacterium]|nr:ComEC/Rec2 family competence protein [Planctomycetales bacterium]